MGNLDISRGNASKINVRRLDKNLQRAFEELVLTLINKYGDILLSIVVFGSATTGEWIRGKSDIDFIVVIRGRRERKEVEDFTNSLLMKISAIYNLKLTETCSAFKKTRNPILNAILAVENFMTFGKPFFVLSKDQIRTERGEISDSRIRFVTSIFDSKAIFAMKMKQTGTTIYGEDILKELHMSRSSVEKMKAFVAPLWLILMSFVVFPVDANSALAHSIKATLWACEDTLFYLDKNLSSIRTEISILTDIFHKNVDFDHAEQALRLRAERRSETKTEKGFVARFLLQTPFFVFTLYHHAMACDLHGGNNP
jgi:predicted nucleotidyltransferase